MLSLEQKIRSILADIYNCAQGKHKEDIIKTAMVKMSYKDRTENNIISSVLDSIDEIDFSDEPEVENSPSALRIEASNELISWDDIEKLLDDEEFTKLSEVEREGREKDGRNVLDGDNFREPNELQQDYMLKSDYGKNEESSYSPSSKTYKTDSVDPTDEDELKEIIIGLDNRVLKDGNMLHEAVDVWPPRTRNDIRAK